MLRWKHAKLSVEFVEVCSGIRVIPAVSERTAGNMHFYMCYSSVCVASVIASHSSLCSEYKADTLSHALSHPIFQPRLESQIKSEGI